MILKWSIIYIIISASLVQRKKPKEAKIVENLKKWLADISCHREVTWKNIYIHIHFVSLSNHALYICNKRF